MMEEIHKYVQFHDVNTYVILRIYARARQFKHGPMWWEKIEFRHNKNAVSFAYYVDDKLRDNMNFEQMQDQLKKDGQSVFKVDYQTLLTPQYTLLVQGVDTSGSAFIERSLYEIRLYSGNVYKKYRRDEEREMDSNQARREINSVHEELEERNERGVWIMKLQTAGSIIDKEVIAYLEKCWSLIDNQQRFKQENEKLRNQNVVARMVGTRNKEIPLQTENVEENAVRKWWRENKWTAPEVLSYLRGLWTEINKLYSFKYQNEYMNGRGGFAKLIGFQGMNMDDLLAELNGLSGSTGTTRS